jgi:hypothetical protein
MIANKPPPHNTYHQRCGAGLYAAGGKAGGGGDLRTERLLGSSIISSTSIGSSRMTASSCSTSTSIEVVFGNNAAGFSGWRSISGLIRHILGFNVNLSYGTCCSFNFGNYSGRDFL